MSAGEQGSLKPGWGRPELVSVLSACVAEWERALTAPVLVRDAALQSLMQRSLQLEEPSRSVGFGGVGHHLAQLSRLAHSATPDAPLREQLSVVKELLASAQSALSPEEMARARSLEQASRAFPLAPPPLLSGQDAGPRPASAPPAAPGVGPAPSAQLPRMITSFGLRGVGAASSAPPPPLLSDTAPPAASAQRSLPPGMAPPASVPPMEPVPAPAVGLHAALPGAANRPGQPSLLVRSLLGLRAFGRPAPEPSSAGPGPKGTPSHASSPVLNLQRGSSSPSAPPQALGSGYGGLPQLREPGGGSAAPPPLKTGLPMPRAESAAQAPADKRWSSRGTPNPVSATPARGRAKAGAGRSRPRAGDGEHRWWMGALAALGVCLVVLGIVLVTVMLVRRGDEKPPQVAAPGGADTASSATVAEGAVGAPGSSLPRSKLLNDDERFRSLLSQVHGRGGKESAELRALLDEQASIAAQALQPGCVGPQCTALKEMGKLVTSTAKKRVKRRSRSPDSLRSRWLAGLEMPEIPVEDDPRVQKRFEFYTENPLGRETFQQMLFRCGAYKDAIQSSLIRRGLPKDLIAVAYAESSCYPLAKSPMGAEGLWQFIPDAARAYHLRIIEGVVDERHSPQKATEAAIQYFSDMYAKFGEWDLVFSAYNMGPFGLAARLERVEGEKVGFWELVDAEMIPGETADYAPAIQAIALILNNLQKLKFSGIQQRAPQMTMDLPVPPNTRLSLVARAAATSVEELRRLNLDIKGTSTPNVQNFAVQVSKDSVWQARETLQELLKSKDESDLCAPLNFDWGRQRFTPEMQAACARNLAARGAPGAASPQ